MSTGRSDRSIAARYIAVYPAAMVLGVVGPYMAITAVNALPYRVPHGTFGVVLVLALNALPAALAGFALYYAVARHLQRAARPSSRHWRRALPLYVSATLLLGVTGLAAWANPASGLFAQLFIWPALAALGGAIGDWLAWPSGRVTLAV